MRINVYAEELTTRVEIIRKPVNQELFRGVRLYLASPDVLHHSPEDNDESAITIWIPWTRNGGHDFEFVASVLEKMAQQVRVESHAT
jgi:hypothetical protein